MSKSNDYREAIDLENILRSGAFVLFLKKRKIYLQQEVNKLVRHQRSVEAFGAVSKLDDLDKMEDLIKLRIAEIRKGE